MTPYRVDIDVYRMGGRAWLDGASLYRDGVLFHTVAGLDLPFTYPPLAAAVFAPFAMLSLNAASATITAVTFVLLVVTTTIVLTRLDVWTDGNGGVAGRGVVAPAAVYLEPIRSNFEFGQINVVLMTLVIADCVPQKTPWPRGLLLGVAIALKLTPAVFLLYLLLRRDTRALLTSIASAVLATAVGFIVAPRDSWEYWTSTIRDTDRIGTADLSDQPEHPRARWPASASVKRHASSMWLIACFAVLGLTWWAVRRVLRAETVLAVRAGDKAVLALMCVAMFGLVVSPVSWSHHWVWALPAILTTAVLGVRYRNVAMGMISVSRDAADLLRADPPDGRTRGDLSRAVAPTAGRFLRLVGAGADRGGGCGHAA